MVKKTGADSFKSNSVVQKTRASPPEALLLSTSSIYRVISPSDEVSITNLSNLGVQKQKRKEEQHEYPVEE